MYEVLSRNCLTRMWDREAFYARAALQKLRLPFYRIDFIYKEYSADEAAEIWQKVRAGEEIPGCCEGNQFRDKIF